MTQSPRYLFALPDVEVPVGGVNVVMGCINALNAVGYSAAPLYGRADYRYAFASCDVQGFFEPRLLEIPKQMMGRKERARTWLRDLTAPGKGPAQNMQWQRRAEDVLILPEFWYPEMSRVFAQNRRVLLAQDIFGLSRAYLRDLDSKEGHLAGFAAMLTTSEASQAAVEFLTGHQSLPIPLPVTRPGLAYRAQKKKQICYMPRKRREEVALVVAALKARPAFQDWSFVPIDKVSPEKLDQILSDSLMFISFSHQEGFGLPPAEAMASGAIVVGYTGVGGNEYFNTEVGIPVEDSDIIAFASTVEALVTEYDANPARLDGLRKHASTMIWSRYSETAHQKGLLDSWEKLESVLAATVA